MEVSHTTRGHESVRHLVDHLLCSYHLLPFRNLGHFDDENDAARAVDAAYEKRGLPQVNAAALSGGRGAEKIWGSSIYYGVSWSRQRKTWLGYILCNGKQM